jgi:hypothetical protein
MAESRTTELLERVAQRLVSLGEISFPYTYRLHTHQGHNSHVYILSSGRKELVVHLTKPFEHYFSDRTWEKLCVVSTFLRQETKLPIPRMILADPMDDCIVSVQEKLPGDIAGTVAIVDQSVVYTWLQNKAVLMPQILSMLAKIHSILVSGYGLPLEKNGTYVGSCATWQEFLLQRISLWLDALESGTSVRTLDQDLHAEMTTYAKQLHLFAPLSQGSLIHGDLGNPSNILAEHNVITGFIDWEFALIGDAAWEFCDEGWVETIKETRLDTYFQTRNINTGEQREKFLQRITLYRPLQCLMWLYVHRSDEDPSIFDTCVALLRKDLADAKQC